MPLDKSEVPHEEDTPSQSSEAPPPATEITKGQEAVRDEVERVFEFEGEEMNFIDPKDMTLEGILSAKGVFKFSKIKRKLGIETAVLTKILRKAKEEGVDTYTVYGFKKLKRGQYIVRMSVFAPFYKKWKQEQEQQKEQDAPDIQQLTRDIENANDLLQQEGVYHFKDVLRFSPFGDLSLAIKNQVKEFGDIQSARQQMGVWKPQGMSDFVVDMQIFRKWFFTHLFPQFQKLPKVASEEL